MDGEILVQAGELELAAQVFDGEGPDILLVMGLNAQMLLWPDGFCEALAAAGHRVIRFDNRDVGNSTRMDHLGTPNFIVQYLRARAGLSIDARYSLADMAADATRVLDHFGIEKCCWVGASMGGMLVQRGAIHHPDRMTSLVSIMSSPSAAKPRPRAALALLRRPRPGRQGFIDAMVRHFQVIGSQTHPIDVAHVRDMAERCFERGGPSPRGFMRQFCAILADGSRFEALRECDVPALVIHGAQDPLIPLTYGIRTAKALGCRLEVHPEMGHDLPPIVWEPMIASISSHAKQHA